MKKILPLLLTCLVTVSARADVTWYEGFNYPDGNITNVSAGLWINTSGTGSDLLVADHKLQIAATGGVPVGRADDDYRFLSVTNGSVYTNASQVMYASFTVNCTNLPNAAGTYFASFYNPVSGAPGGFWGRTYALTSGTTTPGTWRLGVAGRSTAVSQIVPVDLALNTDYQVVVQWDPITLFAITIWVNPINSGDPSTTSSDALTPPTVPINSYAIRQAGTFGNFFANMTNLVVATTFEEAATNIWSTNAVPPLIVNSPKPATNFVGDAVTLRALASGQGLRNLTYQWQKDGADITNPSGNTNAFSIASAVIGDTGDYRLIVTTPYGLSATSSVAFLWVTNAPIPPTISPTTNSTVAVSFHQTTSLHVTASGPPTITYAWFYNNGPLGPNASGDGTDTLTITDVFTNNSTAGAYKCVASNPYGNKTSGVFTVTAGAPSAVSIAFLRTLVDPTTFLATNSTTRWQVTGTVTTFTNLTSVNTSSYYLQDGTAGINIFITLGSSFRPAQGDVLTFVGFLSSFQSTLELEADASDVSTSYVVLSNNIASLPAPVAIPFSITNNNISFVETNLEGRIVMLTNVYFGTNAGTVTSTTANTSITVTNESGQAFSLLFSAQDQDTAGQTLPAFANTVVGPFTQNLGNGVTPRDQGYQVTVTRFSDIVTNPITLSITQTGGTNAVSWAAAPYSYSYTLLTATNVSGPYAPEYQQFQAILLGANEFPANASTASGYGLVVLSPDQTTITVDENFTGLSAPATASHIHGPAGPGANAGVLFPFSGVPAATSGAIPQQTFSITPTQVGYLRNGLLYMNVHDATFPGGEIRAQLLPVPLRFTTPDGSYSDAAQSGGQKFYRLTTP